MSAASDPVTAAPARSAANPAQIRDAKKQFELINRERLKRVRQSLPAKQKGILDLLPLVLHANHPLLPGYVGKDAPSGIANYAPDEVALKAANRMARSFEHRRRASRSVDIHAVYLMGSSGTIAYSKESDFDVWVCHRPDMTESEIQLLESKSAGISAWAETLGLEVNFYIMSAKDFRDGRPKVLSAESSGTAQHYLLLDEFYRTSLLLAGRYPAWWLVPPDAEDAYDTFLMELQNRRRFDASEWVDFGPVHRVPAAEFFGATLWQLSKAIASPHKSLLKIILLEAYALEYPDIDLLSVRYKRAIWDGERSLANLDPYVIFMHKVEDHLGTLGDKRRRQLARRSFYLKVNLALSQPKRMENDWRSELMAEYIKAWGWSAELTAQLDARNRWRIDQILEERNSIVNALVHSYKALTRFGRRHAEDAQVSDHDLTILGRKLYAAFERKAGKIELVSQGIEHRLEEEDLTLTFDAKSSSWRLQHGMVNAPVNGAIRTGSTALELIAWCYFNGVADRSTRFHVFGTLSRRLEHDAQLIRAELDEHFPTPVARIVDVEIYARPPATTAASVFVNVGIDPLETITKKGMRLTSNHGDALNYGGLQENLVKSVDYLLVNSWGEVLTFSYDGVQGLLECICEHVNRSKQALQAPPPIHCHAHSSDYAQTIERRVQELCRDVIDWASRKANGSLFVIKSENSYYALQRTDAGLWLALSGSRQDFVQFLGRVDGEDPLDITFDERMVQQSAIATAYGGAKPSQICCSYQLKGKRAELYVVDEKGALFFDDVPFDDETIVVRNLSEFLESVHYRQASESFDVVPPALKFFEIVRKSGGLALRAVQEDYRNKLNPSSAVQVIAQLTKEGETIFSLFCEDQEFSTQQHGEGVFEALAQSILAKRRGRQAYPIHITDLDLSRLSKNASRLHTVHYLTYRRRFEARVNQYISADANN